MKFINMLRTKLETNKIFLEFISLIVIGFTSIFLALKANLIATEQQKISEKQNVIAEIQAGIAAEQNAISIQSLMPNIRPIISYPEGDQRRKNINIDIYNTGDILYSLSSEIFCFVDVCKAELNKGVNNPITYDVKELNKTSIALNDLFSPAIIIYDHNSGKIQTRSSDQYYRYESVSRQFYLDNFYWQTKLRIYLKINYMDKFKKDHTDYYTFDSGVGAIPLSVKTGDALYKEFINATDGNSVSIMDLNIETIRQLQAKSQTM